jgi:hypothetical protein
MWKTLAIFRLKNTCNIWNTRLQHTCIAIATLQHPSSAFATLTWNTCNILLKCPKHLKHTFATYNKSGTREHLQRTMKARYGHMQSVGVACRRLQGSSGWCGSPQAKGKRLISARPCLDTLLRAQIFQHWRNTPQNRRRRRRSRRTTAPWG